MKKTLLLLFVFAALMAKAQDKQGDTALLIIDIQYFYYPDGKAELVNPEPAGKKAKVLLENFRKSNKLVVHVKHKFEPGGAIHKDVKPLKNEKVISKDEVNSFKGTDLQVFLSKNNVKYLIICGMQTHMCVEAATRAASDLGYKCTVVHDACATKNLRFGDKEIKAEDVHYATLNTLKSYAKVVGLEDFLKE